MTKYKLEEFKAWLEEKPERKAHLVWNQHTLGPIEKGWDSFLENFDRGTIRVETVDLYHRIALKWKAEVDSKREAESTLNQKTQALTQEQINQLTQELNTTKDLNAKLQADNRDLLKDIQQANKTNQELTKKIADLKPRIQALELDKQDLIKQNKALNKELEEYIDTEKSQIKQEITLLKGVLA